MSFKAVFVASALVASSLVNAATLPIRVSRQAAGPSCDGKPAGTILSYSASGALFDIVCGEDYAGADLRLTYVGSFQSCMDTCDAESACVAIAYEDRACYLKSSVPDLISKPSVSSAKKTPRASASCEGKPAGSQGTFVSSNGNFEIICGQEYRGGDLIGTRVESFPACIEECAKNSECIDVSYVYGACYLKNTLTTLTDDRNVWTAKLIGGRADTTSSSTSTSTATATASAAPTAISCDNNRDNGKTYTDAEGNQFIVECGVDYFGGDAGRLDGTTFETCMDACGRDNTCIDVSFVYGTCYMKDNLREKKSLSYVWTGRLISTPSFSTTTSSSASTTSSTVTDATTSTVTDGATTTSEVASASTDNAGSSVTDATTSTATEDVATSTATDAATSTSTEDAATSTFTEDAATSTVIEDAATSTSTEEAATSTPTEDAATSTVTDEATTSTVTDEANTATGIASIISEVIEPLTTGPLAPVATVVATVADPAVTPVLPVLDPVATDLGSVIDPIISPTATDAATTDAATATDAATVTDAATTDAATTDAATTDAATTDAATTDAATTDAATTDAATATDAATSTATDDAITSTVTDAATTTEAATATDAVTTDAATTTTTEAATTTTEAATITPDVTPAPIVTRVISGTTYVAIATPVVTTVIDEITFAAIATATSTPSSDLPDNSEIQPEPSRI